MVAGVGFMLVLIASAFLDGESWGVALAACLIGAGMMWLQVLQNRKEVEE